MSKKKTEESTPREIEALKSGEIRIGQATLNKMNQTQEKLINLVYDIEQRVAALEVSPDLTPAKKTKTSKPKDKSKKD